jgi:hypothetical protein
LGGFISEDIALRSWLQEKAKNWEEAVADPAEVAPNFPQTAYSGLQKALQQEWQFVQRVTKGIGSDCQDFKLVLAKTFLPTLFGDDYNESDPHHKLSCLPVKWAASPGNYAETQNCIQNIITTANKILHAGVRPTRQRLSCMPAGHAV